MDQSPEIVTGTAVYVEDEVGNRYIAFAVAVEDAEGDFVGGGLYFTVRATDGRCILEYRTVTDDDPDPSTEAWFGDETVTAYSSALAPGSYTLDPVLLRDAAGNWSNSVRIEVTE